MEDSENNQDVHKHVHLVHEHKPKYRLNWWMILSLVLFVLLIGAIVWGLNKGSSDASTLKPDEAADKALLLINQNILKGQAVATKKNVSVDGGLYKLVLSLQGQDIESYITKDAKLFFPSFIDLTKSEPSSNNQQPATEVTKSDKPVVELFVMSHCPYGTQIEKGIIPAIETLGDKVDFKLKFVNYAMHYKIGEVEEQINQYCIQKEHPEQLLPYLKCFLEAGKGNDCLLKLNLTVGDCYAATDKEFNISGELKDQSKWRGQYPRFSINELENQKYSIQGSPTLIINGVVVSSGRDAKSLLSVICSAFNSAPEECKKDLSTYGAPSIGFGYTAGAAGAASAECGA